MSLNSKHINDALDRYFGGKMDAKEMHDMEKLALSDPFLKDAMEGFEANPSALNYFNNKILRNYKFQWQWLSISILSIGFVVMCVLYFSPSKNTTSILNEEQAKPTVHQKSVFKPQEIEMIPMELETLKVIHPNEQVQSKELEDQFSDNTSYVINEKLKPQLDNIDIKIDPKLVEDNAPKIVAKKLFNQKNYPYIFFYHLAVLDYSVYENREKIVKKTTFKLSGVSADFESAEAKNQPELIAETKNVPYLDYLEETMYYFSKNKYKYALKRLNIIGEQYKNDLNSMFYGGMCYFNLGDYQKALAAFDSIILLNVGPFHEEAKWYKAKTLIRLEEIEKAEEVLLDIVAENGFYKNQALVLLKSKK